MEKNRIGSQYLHHLQAVYHDIERRGIAVDLSRLQEAASYVEIEIVKELKALSGLWGCHVYIGAGNDDKSKDSVNLNSSQGARTPLAKFKSLGYIVPKVPGRDEEGNYVSKESLAELTLQKMLSTNQMGHLGGDPAILSILRIRELSTLDSRYIKANLYNRNGLSLFLSSYNVVGTTTGRRASKKHVFNYGNNGQNFPKHGELAKIFRKCLVAREGKIFLMVDQMQAEDWPVSALADNHDALHDLRTGVDRHTKLASMIFNIPLTAKTEGEWKDSIERYMGKKTRHANNYGMRAPTMADSLAKEGKSYTIQECSLILQRVNEIDPSVDKVFHAYIKQELDRERILRTPFGRERQFFGLRAGEASSNNKIFNEAYSYIPQSTVGDNTGFAVFDLETNYKEAERCIVQEGHDSIVQEVDDDPYTIWDYIQRTRRAFCRDIHFHNGITVNIPVEGELSYDFAYTVALKNKTLNSKKLEDLNFGDLKGAWEKLQEYKEKEKAKDAAKKIVENVDNCIC